MFRPFLNQFTNLNTCINNQYRNISISHFDTIMKPFLKNFEPIKKLTPKLEQITHKADFKNLGYELEKISNSIKIEDIDSLKCITSDNFYKIDFNEYNYFKYPFLKTDLLTAYLIIWNYNAETNIHTHPSNGCYILNLDGKWEETIYNTKNVEKRIIHGRDVCFINNEIGSHKVKFIESDFSKVGFSLNIYSPTSEII